MKFARFIALGTIFPRRLVRRDPPTRKIDLTLSKTRSTYGLFFAHLSPTPPRATSPRHITPAHPALRRASAAIAWIKAGLEEFRGDAGDPGPPWDVG